MLGLCAAFVTARPPAASSTLQPADHLSASVRHPVRDLARARARDYLVLSSASGRNHSARWELKIEESFQAFAAALRNASQLQPRLIVSEGCSGSSATVQITEQLLEAHGIRVATGPRKKQCSDVPGDVAHCANRVQESELFKCEKNPFCARPGTPCGTVTPHGDGNVTAAMIGVVAEAVADGLSLVVKSESNWGEASRLGFGVMRQLGAHAVIAWRSNSLSKLVCSARDCFGHLGDAAYHPVQLTGPNAHACFERRKLPSDRQSHVWLNVSSLVDRTLAPMQSMPEDLASHLTGHGWGMLNGRLATDGGTVATVTTESLLGHQASNESAVFERGVAAWSSVLASIGVQPQERLVRRELSAQRGARPGTSIWHALDKSCTDDVTAELKRAGQPYDRMIEGDAEL